ncbi:hypothetical protein MIND_00583400 [Mycena indigotica]|uniref:C2 domain-containing protein n=1 Tax=Mycena indigotica TaxID=2126181 RepID=A0A8H6W3F0_9AGAR|nr:uncharacterized protein MIND_00583400 [Mycena indigotica]KAF7303542.1 hypothetical protein MIND_00583400 [Mycena indigotica]
MLVVNSDEQLTEAGFRRPPAKIDSAPILHVQLPRAMIDVSIHSSWTGRRGALECNATMYTGTDSCANIDEHEPDCGTYEWAKLGLHTDTVTPPGRGPCAMIHVAGLEEFIASDVILLVTSTGCRVGLGGDAPCLHSTTMSQTYILRINSAQDPDSLDNKPVKTTKLYAVIRLGGPTGQVLSETKKMKGPQTTQWSVREEIIVESNDVKLNFTLFHWHKWEKDDLLAQQVYTVQELLDKSATGDSVPLDTLNKNDGSFEVWLTPLELDNQVELQKQPLWKKILYKKAQSSVKGLSAILDVLNPIVPAPFNAPLQVLDTLFGWIIEYQNNKEDLEALVMTLTEAVRA